MSGWDLHIPTLETERLRLRAPQASDFEAYAAFCASPRSQGVGGPYPRHSAWDKMCALIGQWAFRGYGRWMVADKTTDVPLGVTGVFHPEGWPAPEIAWSVFDDAEGRGIAFEAASRARKYAYDVIGMDSIVSCVMPDNTRSRALAERMGCTFENVFEHEAFGPLHVWRHPSPAEIAA